VLLFTITAFTLFPCSGDFGVMQRLCFYPFSLFRRDCGNAALLLLPFFFIQTRLRQCKPSGFTPFLCSDEFGAMQRFCFYPFSLFRRGCGNAALLLLPFFFIQTRLRQCKPSAFTIFLYSDKVGAMQRFSFYPFSLFKRVWGNEQLILLPFYV
jgi:hypothetical protein